MPQPFSRATPNTLASRRIVSAHRVDKKQEFIRHIKSLNRSLADWFKEQVANDAAANLRDCAQV